jgi:glyoxylase I family protein
MKFEHFALNVPDVRAMSRWYVEHAGLQILRQREDAPYTHFLGDDTGRVFIELYSNPAATYPSYATQHPLVLHFALFSTDAAADRARMEKAGATFFVEDTGADGTRLIMMRDPWGVALQLCQRGKPFPGF